MDNVERAFINGFIKAGGNGFNQLSEALEKAMAHGPPAKNAPHAANLGWANLDEIAAGRERQLGALSNMGKSPQVQLGKTKALALDDPSLRAFHAAPHEHARQEGLASFERQQAEAAAQNKSYHSLYPAHEADAQMGFDKGLGHAGVGPGQELIKHPIFGSQEPNLGQKIKDWFGSKMDRGVQHASDAGEWIAKNPVKTGVGAVGASAAAGGIDKLLQAPAHEPMDAATRVKHQLDSQNNGEGAGVGVSDLFKSLTDNIRQHPYAYGGGAAGLGGLAYLMHQMGKPQKPKEEAPPAVLPESTQ